MSKWTINKGHNFIKSFSLRLNFIYEMETLTKIMFEMEENNGNVLPLRGRKSTGRIPFKRQQMY